MGAKTMNNALIFSNMYYGVGRKFFEIGFVSFLLFSVWAKPSLAQTDAAAEIEQSWEDAQEHTMVWVCRCVGGISSWEWITMKEANNRAVEFEQKRQAVLSKLKDTAVGSQFPGVTTVQNMDIEYLSYKLAAQCATK